MFYMVSDKFWKHTVFLANEVYILIDKCKFEETQDAYTGFNLPMCQRII